MNDFKNYTLKHKNISSSKLDSYEKTMNVTPVILEETQLNGTLISVFDRLMKDRMIFINDVVDTDMAEIIKAQIMYLDSISDEPIRIYINTPGGSVSEGLVIYDSYCLAKCKIHTICHGMAASMGSILLGAGENSNRFITKYSRVMLHQVSNGVSGNIQDITIAMNETVKYNNILFELLGDFCNKPSEQVKKDADRDKWLNSVESLQYGIVDKILWNKDTIITLDNLDTIKDSILYNKGI